MPGETRGGTAVVGEWQLGQRHCFERKGAPFDLCPFAYFSFMDGLGNCGPVGLLACPGFKFQNNLPRDLK